MAAYLIKADIGGTISWQLVLFSSTQHLLLPQCFQQYSELRLRKFILIK